MWPETKCVKSKERESGFGVICWGSRLGMKGWRRKKIWGGRMVGALVQDLSRLYGVINSRDDWKVIEPHKVLRFIQFKGAENQHLWMQGWVGWHLIRGPRIPERQALSLTSRSHSSSLKAVLGRRLYQASSPSFSSHHGSCSAPNDRFWNFGLWRLSRWSVVCCPMQWLRFVQRVFSTWNSNFLSTKENRNRYLKVITTKMATY